MQNTNFTLQTISISQNTVSINGSPFWKYAIASKSNFNRILLFCFDDKTYNEMPEN